MTRKGRRVLVEKKKTEGVEYKEKVVEVEGKKVVVHESKTQETEGMALDLEDL